MKKILFLLALVLGFFASQAQVGRSQGFYNVLNYGMKNDSTGDQTALLRSIVASLPDGATLYFPAGKYLFSDSILINKNVLIFGDGYAPYPSFTGVDTPTHGATTLFFSSPTKNFFHFGKSTSNKSPIWQLEKLSIINNSTTRATSGSAVVVTDDITQSIMRDVLTEKFYINVDIESAVCVQFDNCRFIGPVLYGLKIKNFLQPDGSGVNVNNCRFFADTLLPAPVAGVYFESGGAVKIVNSDFNSQGFFATSSQFQYPLLAHVTNSTSDFKVYGNLFENFQFTAIKIDNQSGSRFSNIEISGNQIAPFNAAGTALSANRNR